MKKKQIAASLLALTVACSMTACSGKPEEAADTTAAAAEQGEIAGDTNNDGQIDMGVDENVEVKQEPVPAAPRGGAKASIDITVDD